MVRGGNGAGCLHPQAPAARQNILLHRRCGISQFALITILPFGLEVLKSRRQDSKQLFPWVTSRATRFMCGATGGDNRATTGCTLRLLALLRPCGICEPSQPKN